MVIVKIASTLYCVHNAYDVAVYCAGTITLLDGDKILWSLFVDHQLFALTKLDVTVSALSNLLSKHSPVRAPGL